MEQVVAAVAWRSARNQVELAFIWLIEAILSHEAERAQHQINDVFRFKIAPHEQVIPRQATHRPPIDDAVFPLLVVAQVGGGEVFDGVEGAGMERRLAVWLIHADVESGDNVAADTVLAANVDATEQALVVKGKTRNFIHSDSTKLRVIWNDSSATTSQK